MLDPYKTVTLITLEGPLYQDSKDWEKLLAVMEEQPADLCGGIIIWHSKSSFRKKGNAQNTLIELKSYWWRNTLDALKKEAAIWHEMTVIEEMMSVYLNTD